MDGHGFCTQIERSFKLDKERSNKSSRIVIIPSKFNLDSQDSLLC